MEKRKISIALLIIGIGLFVAAPILGYTLDKVQVVSSTIRINEDSSSGLQKAYAIPVSIQKDQKITIGFAVNRANVTATLKIVGKGYYDQQHALNNTPGSLSGLNFIYSQFVWGQAPSTFTGSSTSRTITNNGYWYVEFGGSTSGDFVISIPGSYVIVVYGSNSGPSSDTIVQFNLLVKVDGPGEFLRDLFYYIGAGVIAIFVFLISYGFYKKLRREI
ncbi:MAG: hypothetical protein ACW986_17595 [Promethearchaeota archaeon]|jgi:hypothetical protein